MKIIEGELQGKGLKFGIIVSRFNDFITNKLLDGVQELLGHANIATTQIYTQLYWQHLAKAYDAAHPRARRKS